MRFEQRSPWFFRAFLVSAALACSFAYSPVQAETFLACAESASARCATPLQQAGTLAYAPREFEKLLRTSSLDSVNCPHQFVRGAQQSVDYGAELAYRAPLLLHRLAGDDLRAFFGFIPRLTVLQADHSNAFALPSGMIAFTKGLLAQIRTDEELAFVLAHELGHLALHHHNNPQAFLRTSDVAVDLLRRELEADAYAVQLLKNAGMDPRFGIQVLERAAGENTSRALTSRRRALERSLTSTP